MEYKISFSKFRLQAQRKTEYRGQCKTRKNDNKYNKFVMSSMKDCLSLQYVRSM